MSITYQELLHLTESLIGENECSNRASASRAYYGAYQFCKEQLDVIADRTIRGGMHRQYIDTLINNSDSTVRSIGYKLQQMHRLRVKADYKIAQDFTRAQALQSYRGALEIVR